MTMRSLRIRYSSSSNSRWVRLDLTIAAGYLVRVDVQGEIPDAQWGRAAGWTAPQQRPHARKQLLAARGLSEVVVGARVESLDAGLQGVSRCENQDRHVVVVAQPLGDIDPVDLGQAEVEDHEVGGERATVLERGGAVRGGAHLIALHAQRALECLCNVLVVLDHQDAGSAGVVTHLSQCSIDVHLSHGKARSRLTRDRDEGMVETSEW